MAIIITTHMPMNDAATPAHVWPGMGIHAGDMAQPPGIGMPPMFAMAAPQSAVSVALAANSSAETPKNSCGAVRSSAMGGLLSLLAVFVVAAAPEAGLVASFGGAVEPGIHAPHGVEPA